MKMIESILTGSLLAFLLIATPLSAQEAASFSTKFSAQELEEAPAKLIPFPQQLEWKGQYTPVTEIKLVESEALTPELRTVLTEMLAANNVELATGASLSLTFATEPDLGAEAYTLDISPSGITSTAATETGHYYALQTLRQLIQQQEGEVSLPVCRIEDEPAFPTRGFLIDVGRNFQSIASLKQQLDIMARYKLNTFQWHLTDYPAWRIESRAFPELTAASSHRSTRDPGKYYSYDDMRELIAYAKERHITIIPEIDMPGHSDAFTEAMGFTMDSEEGMEALEVILAEFFAEISREDCPVIHLGSDEVRIDKPQEFMDRMVAFCNDNGREVMTWNPGLETKYPVIQQTWRSPAPELKEGDKEVDSWNSYINNGEPMTQVQRLFFKPIGYGSDNEVIGGILCLWPDVNLDNEEDAFSQNPVYPSMLTYAWTSWTADIDSASTDYYMTLPPRDSAAFAYFAAFEDILLHHKEEHFSDKPFPYLRQTDKAWRVIGPFDGDEADGLLQDTKDSYTIGDTQHQWQAASGNTLVVNDRFRLGGYYPEATAGQSVYALTYIHADRDREVPTWIGFETPMRPNRTYTGIPEQGQWDPNGGNIWINDTPLPAPEWQRPGWKPSNQNGWAPLSEREQPWTDEELYWTRPPATVPLKEGWNKVLVKIPASTAYQNWMFTFAPLEMEGLTFAASPSQHSTYYDQRKTHFESLPNTPGEIIMLGNSITDGAEWGELLGDPRIKNRGISGDVTQGILDRLGEVTESNPDRVFLLIGTNDLARGHSTDYVIDNIGRIVRGINEASPQTKVYVQSILPVNDHYGMFGGHTSKGEQIRTVNAALARGIDGDYEYLDLYPSFTGDGQKMNIEYSNDGLHLNGAGYRLWASLLKDYIE